LSPERCRKGRHRADFCSAHERDFPDGSVASAAFGASQRRLDADNGRGTCDAGTEAVLLQARPFRRRVQLGPGVACYFDAFSSREPASTLLENAMNETVGQTISGCLPQSPALCRNAGTWFPSNDKMGGNHDKPTDLSQQ